MQKTNDYRVEVFEDTDFIAGWKDPATPHIDYMFDQESLAECEEIDGKYFATYKTWVVETERVIEMVTKSGIEYITVPIGEYGKL